MVLLCLIPTLLLMESRVGLLSIRSTLGSIPKVFAGVWRRELEVWVAGFYSLGKVPKSLAGPTSLGQLEVRVRGSGEVVGAAVGTARHQTFLLRLCLTPKYQLCGARQIKKISMQSLGTAPVEGSCSGRWEHLSGGLENPIQASPLYSCKEKASWSLLLAGLSSLTWGMRTGLALTLREGGTSAWSLGHQSHS